MWALARRTPMIFLIDSWKAVLLTAPDRARERSTRLLVDEAFRMHMAFLLGNGFGWCKIRFSTNIVPASLILIIFLLQRAVEDIFRVLVALVVLVVATEKRTIDLLKERVDDHQP